MRTLPSQMVVSTAPPLQEYTRLEVALCRGVLQDAWVVTRMISAGLPTASVPVARPSPFAPFTVAMASASCAGRRVGLFQENFWSRAAVFASSNMSRLLFEAHPSVPRQTFAPAWSSQWYGMARLVASFMLLDGLCDAETPRFPRRLHSSSESQQQWAATVRGVRIPHSSRWTAGRFPCRAMQSFTSFSVSERWIWIPIFSAFAYSAHHFRPSGETV